MRIGWKVSQSQCRFPDHSLWSSSDYTPQTLQAHSMRAQVTLISFLSHASILDICRDAKWSSMHTFTKHYAITTSSRSDANFGTEVLQSLFTAYWNCLWVTWVEYTSATTWRKKFTCIVTAVLRDVGADMCVLLKLCMPGALKLEQSTCLHTNLKPLQYR